MSTYSLPEFESCRGTFHIPNQLYPVGIPTLRPLPLRSGLIHSELGHCLSSTTEIRHGLYGILERNSLVTDLAENLSRTQHLSHMNQPEKMCQFRHAKTFVDEGNHIICTLYGGSGLVFCTRRKGMLGWALIKPSLTRPAGRNILLPRRHWPTAASFPAIAFPFPSDRACGSRVQQPGVWQPTSASPVHMQNAAAAAPEPSEQARINERCNL